MLSHVLELRPRACCETTSAAELKIILFPKSLNFCFNQDGFWAKVTTRPFICYSAQLRLNVGLDIPVLQRCDP